jgi:hypothetical protein
MSVMSGVCSDDLCVRGQTGPGSLVLWLAATRVFFFPFFLLVPSPLSMENRGVEWIGATENMRFSRSCVGRTSQGIHGICVGNVQLSLPCMR